MRIVPASGPGSRGGEGRSSIQSLQRDGSEIYYLRVQMEFPFYQDVHWQADGLWLVRVQENRLHVAPRSNSQRDVQMKLKTLPPVIVSRRAAKWSP